MFYEVYIPSNTSEGFDVTITVEADNWMLALKSGLERTGEGADIRNVMCDIKDDNTIHVTDASTRRVFVLRELSEEESEAELAEVQEEQEEQEDDFATQKMPALPQHQPPPQHAPPPSTLDDAATGRFDRSEVPTKKQFQPPPSGHAPPPSVRDSGLQKTVPPAHAPPPQARPAPAAGSSAPTAPLEAPENSAADVAANPSAPSEQVAPPEPAAQPAPALEPATSLAAESWTSEDGRMRIGSSTFEALRRDEPEPKVLRETRAPSGQRQAIDLGRANESVSQSALEEVFLEIQQIHEQRMSMEQVINFVMDLCMAKISAEAGSIMFADVNGQELYFATARGPKAHDVMDFRVPMSKGFVGFCAREGVSLAISDAEKDPRFYKAISDALGYETRNICCAPVQFEGRVYGCIELMNKSQPFTNTEVSVLTYVGRQLAKFVHDLIMAREKIE